MLRNLTDTLNSTQVAVEWLRRKHPAEEIVFASAATYLETAGSEAPVGWSLSRFLQRRGSFILTRQQLVFKDSFFSWVTLFYLLALGVSLVMLVSSQDWFYMVLAALASLSILQRWPFQQQIPLQDIRKVEISDVSSFMASASLLTIYVKDKAINIVPAQILPEAAVQVLSPPTQ